MILLSKEVPQIGILASIRAQSFLGDALAFYLHGR